MHRTDGLNHVANQFSDGVPPTPGTQVEQHWLNAVQEEIANVITNAGVALVKGTWTQLRDVVMNLQTDQSIAGVKTFLGKIVASGNDAVSAVITATGTAGNFGAIHAKHTVAGKTAIRTETLNDTPDDPALNVVKGAVKFTSGANPIDGYPFTNTAMALGLIKGWAHFAWNNGAPTLASGMNMLAPGNPAAGQIQVNLASAIAAGAVVVIGIAGAGAGYKLVAQNITGLVEVQDGANAAVNFNATTGFAFVVVLGRQ